MIPPKIQVKFFSDSTIQQYSNNRESTYRSNRARLYHPQLFLQLGSRSFDKRNCAPVSCLRTADFHYKFSASVAPSSLAEYFRIWRLHPFSLRHHLISGNLHFIRRKLWSWSFSGIAIWYRHDSSTLSIFSLLLKKHIVLSKEVNAPSYSHPQVQAYHKLLPGYKLCTNGRFPNMGYFPQFRLNLS